MCVQELRSVGRQASCRLLYSYSIPLPCYSSCIDIRHWSSNVGHVPLVHHPVCKPIFPYVFVESKFIQLKPITRHPIFPPFLLFPFPNIFTLFICLFLLFPFFQHFHPNFFLFLSCLSPTFSSYFFPFSSLPFFQHFHPIFYFSSLPFSQPYVFPLIP